MEINYESNEQTFVLVARRIQSDTAAEFFVAGANNGMLTEEVITIVETWLHLYKKKYHSDNKQFYLM